MNLQILSDLHMDGAAWTAPLTEADAIVVAGDLFDDGARSAVWCVELAQTAGKPVFFVPGNHDFYDGVISERLLNMHRIACAGDVYLLHNKSVELQGVRFVGTPLWSDFQIDGPASSVLAKHAAQDLMGDFQYIRIGDGTGSARNLRPNDAVRMHERGLRALDRGLTNAYSEKVVVITHHAPSVRSLTRGFRYSPLNGAYASDMDEYVGNSMAKLWVHGHMHATHDYMVGSTRVLCNPRGGPRSLNVDFNPAMVVEV
ncbi:MULTISPECIES: metallophosphoesterase [unclassified Variovorax]|uniref:metallophosphoesterase n=1 Tax=unclassified Variovorax TaxID=663243 RepID=UPI001315B777|nr:MULTISPECIES: metallophosphoesterase [unclassified Variovorax]VTU42168.1 cyclic 3',5'-adenosine monophosphate phosphodiesterase [Variovorax sp. SRS16]VTU42200.1 cyclic 3',5'-adenosine monophosphate phosphodiesterase [Variovorax sp. PBL-E5]VTU44310.1 cyclic 3',5'-adenosine monophosphate phosphodiesterase [Variovorax sp. PBL-H6]